MEIMIAYHDFKLHTFQGKLELKFQKLKQND